MIKVPKIHTEEILRRLTYIVSSVARKAPGLAITQEEISTLFTPDIDISPDSAPDFTNKHPSSGLLNSSR